METRLEPTGASKGSRVRGLLASRFHGEPRKAAISLLLGLVVAIVVAIAPPVAAAPTHQATGDPGDRFVLYVPSTEGGGLDQTAMAMKEALEAEGLARQVVIQRRPGGGGLVGLAEFVEAHRGNSRFLILGGTVMLDAAKANQSAISLLNATPIARLTKDYEAIAVPATSPLHTLGDLLEVQRAHPGTLHWMGAASGTTDELLARRIAAQAGNSPHSLAYEAMAGSGEVTKALQAAEPDVVGVSALGELEPYAAAGGFRILAVAAEGRRFGGAPTLRASGLDVVSSNWRGVFGPPGLDPAQRRHLIETLSRMAQSRAWREALRRRGWTYGFVSGE